ncbi:hypothetical protein BUE67_13370, partial [Corynebacterium diphtheriae]
MDFLREGGLGLFLIESLMDEVKVSKESGVTISGASYDDIEDSKIAVSEAVTNAVKHAYKHSEQNGMINICFELFDDKIKIIISDQGESFDYESTKSKLGPYQENENIDFLREGGLGLFLIESLMDEVKVSKESGVTIS